MALVLSIPFLIYHYHKYGCLTLFRALILYSFILYCICAYFTTILPLPDIEAVRNSNPEIARLMPFEYFYNMGKYGGFVLDDPSTWLKALLSEFAFQFYFNILLLVPLGCYLRYYFKCGFIKTTIISFFSSLFIELTQLSGLYFIYPKPYRLFQTDDLICNTLGGIVGYLIVPLFTFFLPTRDEIDSKSYQKGDYISSFRRIISYIIDVLIVYGIYSILPLDNTLNNFDNSGLLDNIVFGIVFIAFQCIFIKMTKGYTPGKWLCRYKVVRQSDIKKTPFIFQLVARYIILYVSVNLILELPYRFTQNLLSEYSNIDDGKILLISLCVRAFLFFIFMLVQCIVVKHSNNKKGYFHGILTKTVEISTVKKRKIETKI